MYVSDKLENVSNNLHADDGRVQLVSD